MRKSFRFRLYPTPVQAAILDEWLMLCRWLYNALLEQRIAAYQSVNRRSLGFYEQKRELPQLKRAYPEFARVGSQVLQDVVSRVQVSFDHFFRRVRQGARRAGFPKFQGRNRYHSLTFTQAGWKVQGKHVVLTGCGPVKMKLHRRIEGDIKTVTIKRRAGQWFVCFSCDSVPEPQYPPTDRAIGLDLGIESLAVDSDGNRYPNPAYLKRKLHHLRRLSRHLARQKKGSGRRTRTVRQLQRLHLKIANQRADAHHKASTKLVRENNEIHMEQIDPQFMLGNKRLARAAADAGWGQFKQFLHSKAAAAGRRIIEKNPRNTSQECSGCGRLVPKKLSDRWHQCECGARLHRDQNAAIVILRRPA